MADTITLNAGPLHKPWTAEEIAAMPAEFRPYAEIGRREFLKWSADHLRDHGHELHDGQGYCNLAVAAERLAELARPGTTPERAAIVATAAYIAIGLPAVCLAEFIAAENLARRIMGTIKGAAGSAAERQPDERTGLFAGQKKGQA